MVTYLKFTVGALPTGTTAQKATLTLTRLSLDVTWPEGHQPT